ncbi:cell division protein SepF [Bailinhaonella thermotolerans]|uniref:Cell division protein SepF n=1 Tax=Bailinhaonella thermotolerans TaxID=1070861 RepID=A0A3A4AVQ6_9ACTN|nr:cell division protein SepF [Bailinhaonella thermotolerans]RJL34320.1 cell division protein SepF [Bailinhaonella thermotolerans]
MANTMRKMATYLGLAEESGPEYDDYHDPDADAYPDHYDDDGDGEAPALTQIVTIQPRTYNDALSVGRHFRNGVPVIMDLTGIPDEDAKRLVDFAAGLIFGCRGGIERVASKVFLLSPPGVEVRNT